MSKVMKKTISPIGDTRLQSNSPARTAITIAGSALLFAMAAGMSHAQDADEDEAPFAVADVFLELNDTDGDLGLQALIDGDPWRQLEIEDSRGEEDLAGSCQQEPGKAGFE